MSVRIGSPFLLFLLSCLCNSYWGTPGSLFLHCLLEFAQNHVHWVSDAIQPSHSLLSSSLALNLSQQGLFQWVGSLCLVAKVLEPQHQSFQWIFRVDFLSNWLVWSSCSTRDSPESSLAPEFKSINSSALSLLYGAILISVYDYWKDHHLDYVELVDKVMPFLF